MHDEGEEHVRADGVRLELEGGDDAEVAAAAPQQITIGVRACRNQPAVGGHQIGGQQVVAAEAVPAPQPPQAAPEGQPGDPGPGHDTHRHGQPERLGLSVEIADRDTTLGPDRPRGGVDPDALHRREVDHQPAVAHRETGDPVPSAADGRHEPMPAGELHRGEDVGHAGAAGDQTGTPVDGAVPHRPRLVVPRVDRLDQFAAKPAPESRHVLRIDHARPAVESAQLQARHLKPPLPSQCAPPRRQPVRPVCPT